MSRERIHADPAAKQRAYRERKRNATWAANVTRSVLVVADAAALPFPDAGVDLIVTSPPYGLGIAYGTDDAPAAWPAKMCAWLAEMSRITRPRGRLALNVPLDTTKGGYRATWPEACELAKAAGWTFRSTIVWEKGNIKRRKGRGSVDSSNCPHVIAPAEIIGLFSKGEWNRGRKGDHGDLTHEEWLAWTNGRWMFPGQSRRWEGHPAPFPEELPRRLIKLLCFPDDLVCDPFLGSGTTAVVAAQLGRRFLGADLVPRHVASARRRLARAIGP